MALTQKNSNSLNETFHVVQLASGDLWAGEDVMLYTLAKSLHTQLDVKLTVILLNHGTLEEKLRGHGISLYVLDEAQLNGFQILLQLNKIIKSIKPDVIHTHRIKENILGSLIAWYNHTPSIRTTHGTPEHRPPLYRIPKHLILLLERLVGHYCQQFIVAVSEELAKKLGNSFPQSKIRVIENGIDIESLTGNQPQPLAIKSEDNNYRIGIAGRLVPVKRIDLFINAAVYLKQKHPELSIQYDIYGDGPLHDSLKELIQSNQAENYIHLRGHCDNIEEALLSLHALLMTSDHEGLPMVLLEAMCLQVPIIAHSVGGIPNLLDYGKCGILVNEHSAAAFAEAIKNLLTEPDQELTRLAYERVKLNYSAHHTAKKYESIYRSLD